MAGTSDNPYESPLAAGEQFRTSRVRFLVLGWLCLAAIIAYVHRSCIGVAETSIRQELRLSMSEMGWVMSAFFLTYAIFQLPSGWLADRWGTRRALPLFSLLWSLTTAMLAIPFGLPGLLTARLGMGAAQAGIFPCCTCSLRQWFPTTRRGLAVGLLTGSMSVGAAGGALLSGYLLEHWGWRMMFAVYSVPGFLWAAWFFRWFRDSPADHPAVSPSELEQIRADQLEPDLPAEHSRREPTPWQGILSSRAMWCICGQQFFRAAGYIFYTSWFTTYLKEARDISADSVAGALTSLPLWGVVVGGPVGGLLSDLVMARTGSRWLSRQVFAAASMLTCATLILVAYQVEQVGWAVLLLTAGSFCAALGGPCAYAITMDMGGRHVATVFSMMNMAGNIGAVLFPLLVPVLVEYGGSWDMVLFTFAGIYVAAAAFWVSFNSQGSVYEAVSP